MFSEIVSQSFNIWWKNKKLWIVGIIGALTYTSTNQQLMSSMTKDSNDTVLMIFTIIGLCGLFISLILLIYSLSVGVFASIGQILAYRDLIEGKEIGGVKRTISRGMKYWGKYILLSLAFSVPIIIFFIVIGIIALVIILVSGVGLSGLTDSSQTGVVAGMGTLLFLVACCLSIVSFFLLIGYMTHFLMAVRVLILEDKGVMDSIKISFSLIKNNFGKFVLAILVNFGLSILLGIIVGIPLTIIYSVYIFATTFFQSAILNLASSTVILPILVFFVIEVVSIILLSIVSGILGSFSQVYWNSVYLKLSKASNHLVNGEPEKESFGPFVDSKPVESQVPSGL